MTFPRYLGDLSTSIDLNRFEAGQHTLVITAVATGGLTAEDVVKFNVSVKPLSKYSC